MRAFVIAALFISATFAQSLDAHAQTGRRRRTPPRRPPASTAKRPAPAPKPSAAAVTTASGLTYVVTKRGAGRQPLKGETVLVHYTGTLSNGVKFDSSHDRGEPIAFKLGEGRVIKGWDEGVALLRVGDQAVLVIPPALGYGQRNVGNGLIPPGSTLIFVIEVVDVKATTISEVLSRTLKERGVEAMVAQFRELKGKGGDIYTNELDMNAWGYRLLGNKQTKEAVEVFKLNVEAYPQSANVYDSLAEAYLALGEKQLAIDNYKKALELNPQMESARKALQTLTQN
ncbi:MAG TPA: FKBP-type peptidyl-prolyl cis-trans isomerase [Pyrinomonadaceae bacterium]|nr:FKBP-type peptidyl-prolyl cis-trans isomerase [Pyrinomonadaceae bacterium]